MKKIQKPLKTWDNKRLLRIVNQRVHEFIAHSSEGEASVIDFAPNIDEPR